ncbi:unnamed protein product [Adineta steineri]|uniref:TPR repeat-containing protein n=1 Tax=Adineta steineri TaxID=433720 RepID=A0A813Z2R5_9BILA|nr:unnamed protein product [Adineta steineri]CAF1413469.1 unnamed protein product [Adineta steineri]CAF3778343.1 unnamed protein product [Adineta steineri]CAF3892736.1 unnamed protein product [Adineta steineri]
MALANGHYIIWLDTHIGVMGQYQALKNQLQSHLLPLAKMPPNGINELICCFENNVAPIRFVSTIDDALTLIQNETNKMIIFISSGTLGKEIIPTIVSNYTHVHSFYILCTRIEDLSEWALERNYETIMKIYDHEIDLLIRLVRDASNDLIKTGRIYMTLNDGESARKCFVTAQTLERQANITDTFHAPLLTRLRVLEGDNGLIQQTRNMRRGSFDCISKVLSVKDKLIYLVISNTLGKSVVPLIHKHRCIEHIHILQNTDDQNEVDWIKDYSKICGNGTSIRLLLGQIKHGIDLVMKRPACWLRSKTLLTELYLPTSQDNPLLSMEDAAKADGSMFRIVTLFFGTRPLLTQSLSHIQIDEYDNVNECIQSIEAKTLITVFIVILTDGSEDLHSLLELDSIHAIYIIPKDNYNQQIETMSKHSKVSGVFYLDEDLLEQLTMDICFYRHMRVHTPMINTFTIGSNIIDTLNKQHTNFLFFQLFCDILPHIPVESTESAESSTDTINNLFFLLADANVTINNLFSRFDCYTLQASVSQLKKINQCIASFSKVTDMPLVTVYRAQLVSKKDLETIRNNPKIILSIQTFILASRSLRFVTDLCRRAIDSQLTVILFEFNLSESTLIANLNSDTVILNLGALFRLVCTELAPDGVLHVQLESADEFMHGIKEQLQCKIGGRLTWLTFGNYLAYQKQFSTAKEYCYYMLHVLPDNHSSRASIYNNMGLICLAMDDDQEASDWFKKATLSNVSVLTKDLDEESSVTTDLLSPQDSLTSPTALLRRMAEISDRLGDQTTALDLYRQVLEITIDMNLQKRYQEKIRALLFVDEKF